MPGDPVAAWRAFERAGRRWARPDPTRLAFRPDPPAGFDSRGGAAPSPESLGPCTAAPSARPRPMPSPTLRPTPRELATRSSPRAPAPLLVLLSIVLSRYFVWRLYAAAGSVPGLPSPPLSRRGWGGLLFSLHGSCMPCLRAGRPTLAQCGAPQYTRRLTARCRRARLFFSGNSTRPISGPALVRTLRMTASQTDLARPRRCADTGRFVAPIRRKIRRFSASISLPRATCRPPGRSRQHGLGRGRAGRFVQLRKEKKCFGPARLAPYGTEKAVRMP